MVLALEPVAPPPLRPPRLSLVTVARDPLADTARAAERWENGFTYLPVCGVAGVRDPCANTTMPEPDPPTAVEFVPFEVWAASDCPTTIGRGDETLRDELRARATDALALCEAAQIENEFWTGALATEHNAANPDDEWPNRFLASPDSDDLGAGDPVEALACLERTLAGCACGRRGTIHATADTVVWWDRYGLIRTEGGLLVTRNETVVIPGAGYPGTGPDGEAPEFGAWAYATGMVEVRRGEITVTGNVDHRANNLVYRAVRHAAATWDGCCAAGVHVQFDSCAAAS